MTTVGGLVFGQLRRSSGTPVSDADLEMLDRLASEQAAGKATAGGEVISSRLANLSTFERIAVWTGKALEWNAAAGAVYALMHGRDGLNDLWADRYDVDDDAELPAEEFHRVDEGDDLGWPYTYYDPRRGERVRMV